LALLEIAYWLFLHDKRGLAKGIVEDAFRMAAERKIKPNDEKLKEIALKFLKIGQIEEALTVGAIISDERIASRVFEKIALTYAKRVRSSRQLRLPRRFRTKILREMF